jgi:hypothetical protein
VRRFSPFAAVPLAVRNGFAFPLARPLGFRGYAADIIAHISIETPEMALA